MNSDRENRHLSFAKRNRESQNLIFNNPTVPIIYPASGLQVEPHDSIFIPLKIIEVRTKNFQNTIMNNQTIQLHSNVLLKITSSYGKFETSGSDEPKRVLSLSGDKNSVSQKLKYLRKVFMHMISLDEIRTSSRKPWKIY